MTENKKANYLKVDPITTWAVDNPMVCPKLAQKIFNVMSEVGTVEKTGRNQAQNYDYAKETDVLDAVRPLLIENKLLLLKINEEYKNTAVHSTRSGTGQTLTELCATYRWIDIETGHYLDTQQVSTGIDTGDKGSYKASTGGKKYNLLTNLFISTGDDPEADEKTDRNNAPQQAPQTDTKLASDAYKQRLSVLVVERDVPFDLSCEIDDKIRRGILTSEEAKEYGNQLNKLDKLEDSRVSK